MKIYIMAFKDDVAGTFQYFGNFNNIELAKRDFTYACRGANVPSEDLSLYVLCTFDTNTGAVSNIDEDDLGNYPAFVMRGIKSEV